MILSIKNSPSDWFEHAADRRKDFLELYGLSNLSLEAVTSDAAPRRFYRLKKTNGQSFILVESPPDNHPQSIAGHKLVDFMRISQALQDMELSAPEVYEADLESGYLLVEDFGDQKFNLVMHEFPEKETELYNLAVDVLVHLRDKGGGFSKTCPPFYGGYLHKAHRQFVDWFMPYYLERSVTDEEIAGFLNAWDHIEAGVPSTPLGPMYVDYHVENLMYLPERKGLKKCGLLDFSMMYYGDSAYDIAHLTMDARRSISPELRQELIKRYIFGLDKYDRELYLNHIYVMGMHFHLKVAGQIIRWICEGKKGYFTHLPRVIEYIQEGLSRPQFSFLRNFIEECGVDLNGQLPVVDHNTISMLIRNDAFLKS